MRYKDADALIKEIEENQFNWIDENDKSFLINLINRQPGYDIDKVVEQLEKLEKEHPYKVIGQFDTYSQYNEAWQDCMDRVLGIVKRGGAE